MGSAVPSRVSLLISIHTQAESGAYLRDSSRVPRRCPFIYLHGHTPSGQSRVYRVTQLRTDGVHCGESAGTGPVNLKVVPNGCCLAWQVSLDQSICASLSHTHHWYDVGILKVVPYTMMYVMTMYGHTYIISKSMDQPGKVASPARGQLNRKNEYFPVPRSCLRIWSRETGSAVPSRVSLLISIILRLNLVLTYGISPEFRGGVHLFIYNRHTPSGRSRVYRVTQLRTDGVRCRGSAGTGPVNFKVVPNECCLGRSLWTN